MRSWIPTCASALAALFFIGAAQHARPPASPPAPEPSLPDEGHVTAAAVTAVVEPAPVAAVDEVAPLAPPDPRRLWAEADFFPRDEDVSERRLVAPFEPLALAAPFGCARAALVENRAAAALKCLGDARPATLPERYLQGLALQRAARLAEAAPLLERLAGDYPALADHCRWLAGRAWESLGAAEEARRAFAAIDPGSSLADDARLAEARALRRLGRWDEALSRLAPMAERRPRSWGRDVAAEALFAMAELREQKGERREAAALFLKLWSERPRSALSGDALKRAQALRAAPTAALKVVRAEALLNLHRNEAALALIQPLVESPPRELSAESRCHARSVMGRALRKLRRHAQAVEVLAPLVDGCAPDESWAAGLYTAGFSAAGLDTARAISFYLRLEEVLPESELADDALFLAAGLRERAGELHAARRLLRRLILRHPAGDYRAEALFQLAWLSRKEGLLDDALAAFSQLERDYFERDLDAAVRARYWKARVLDELGRPGEATANYEAIAENHPAGFYALLARSQLGVRPGAVAVEIEVEEETARPATSEADAGAPAAVASATTTTGASDADADAGSEVADAAAALAEAEIAADAGAEDLEPGEAIAAAPLKLLPGEEAPLSVLALFGNPRLDSALELQRLGFSGEAVEEL